MAMMDKEWYLKEARRITGESVDGGELKDLSKPGTRVSKDVQVSTGTNPGAWVSCWLWIPDPVQHGKLAEEQPYEG